MHRVDRAQWLLAPEFGGAVETFVVDRNDMHALPVVEERASQRSAFVFDLGHAVDEHERLAARKRGRAPIPVCLHRAEHDVARGTTEIAREEGGRIERERHARISATRRSRRVPTRNGTTTSGRGRSPRRAGTTRPRAASSAMDATPEDM